jgi:hypothetical protein
MRRGGGGERSPLTPSHGLGPLSDRANGAWPARRSANGVSPAMQTTTTSAEVA